MMSYKNGFIIQNRHFHFAHNLLLLVGLQFNKYWLRRRQRWSEELGR